VLALIACYAMSLAPAVWVVISEIFPNRIRGAAVSVAVVALWAGSFTLAQTFPVFNDGFVIDWLPLRGSPEEGHWLAWAGMSEHGTFWLYGAISLLGFLIIFKALPETKGKTLEQIERALVD
jgi:SP family sugar porter-like MFS transporter